MVRMWSQERHQPLHERKRDGGRENKREVLNNDVGERHEIFAWAAFAFMREGEPVVRNLPILIYLNVLPRPRPCVARLNSGKQGFAHLIDDLSPR